jgi:AcrR family transcriptional regulator
MGRKSLNQSELDLREGDFLRLARNLFLAKGIDGLTMENLARKTGYSKGIVYQHFSSREDVLAALCVESDRLRLEFLERAAMFKGRSRERALAVAKADYLIYRLHPEYWITEQLTSMLSLTSKVSPERKAALDSVSLRCADVALGVIRDAVSNGDLGLPSGITPERLLLALLSQTYGIYLVNSNQTLTKAWSLNLPVTQEQIFNYTCDGFGWRPYTRDWDYAGTVQRIWREVFPVEAAQIGELKARGAS